MRAEKSELFPARVTQGIVVCHDPCQDAKGARVAVAHARGREISRISCRIRYLGDIVFYVVFDV